MAIAAALANFVAFGSLFSFGVFLTPLAETFDTSTGPVAPLFSGAVFCYYTAGAVGGRVGDRHGVRLVLLCGTVLMSGGLLLTSVSSELWQTYLFYVPLFGLGVGCCYAPLIGAVGRWFDQRRSMAMGVLLAGVGAGTLVMPTVASAVVDAAGWRTAMAGLGVLTALVVGCASAVSADPPSDGELLPLPVSAVARSADFRRLYLAVVLIGPGFWAPFAFYNDDAIERGIGGPAAAALVGIAGGSSVLVRLVAGSVGDHVAPLRLYRAGYVLMTTSLLLWLVAGGAYAVLVASAVALGAGWAAWVVATPAVLAEWYGVRDLGGVVGVFYTGLGIGALAGPAASGFVIDAAGYRPAIGVVAALAAVASALVLRPVRPAVRDPTPASARSVADRSTPRSGGRSGRPPRP